jgi:Flp pilus assembly protein TadG
MTRHPGPDSASRHRRDERGDVNIFWALGLVIMLLFVGGIAADLWHTVAQARALDAAADNAAAAGAAGIDPTVYRTTGKAVLDPNLATQLALDNLSHATNLPGNPNPQITVSATEITVVLHGQVDLTLMRIFQPGQIDLTSTGNAAARAGP